MSVDVYKVDGKIYSVNISGDDTYNIMKSIAYLIDLCQEGAGMSVHDFQNNENHASIMKLMREF